MVREYESTVPSIWSLLLKLLRIISSPSRASHHLLHSRRPSLVPHMIPDPTSHILHSTFQDKRLNEPKLHLSCSSHLTPCATSSHVCQRTTDEPSTNTRQHCCLPACLPVCLPAYLPASACRRLSCRCYSGSCRAAGTNTCPVRLLLQSEKYCTIDQTDARHPRLFLLQALPGFDVRCWGHLLTIPCDPSCCSPRPQFASRWWPTHTFDKSSCGYRYHYSYSAHA